MEKKKVSSINGAGLTRCLHVDECKDTQIYHPAQNSSPNGINTSKIKPEAMNLIDDKIQSNFEHTGTVDNILNRTPITQVLSSIINK